MMEPTEGLPAGADASGLRDVLARFETGLPLLGRLAGQLLTMAGPGPGGPLARARVAVLVGALALWRAALDYVPECGMTFSDYAEVAILSELSGGWPEALPPEWLPPSLEPYTARLEAMARALAGLVGRGSLGAGYGAMVVRGPGNALMPYMAPQAAAVPMASAAVPEAGPNALGALWRLFAANAVLVIGLVAVTEAGIAYATMTAPRIWVSSTTIDTGIGSRDAMGGGSDWFGQATVIANITELLRSRTVLAAVAGTLSLTDDPEDLADRLTVARLGQAGLLKVEAEAPTAQGAAELANTTVREFMKVYAGGRSRDARSSQAFFSTQVNSAKERLATAEVKLKKFKDLAIPELAASMPTRAADLLGQRDETARNLAAARAGLYVVQRELGGLRRDPSVEAAIRFNGNVTGAGERVSELTANLADARETYGVNHPVTKRLALEVSRARGTLGARSAEASNAHPALADATMRAVQLRTDVAMQSARLASLERALAQAKPAARRASTQAVTYDQLQREVKVAETRYIDLQNKFGQSNMLAQGGATPNVNVVDPAVPPTDPMSNRLALKLVLGFVLSGAFALLLAFIGERLRGAQQARLAKKQAEPVEAPAPGQPGWEPA